MADLSPKGGIEPPARSAGYRVVRQIEGCFIGSPILHRGMIVYIAPSGTPDWFIARDEIGLEMAHG